MITIAYTISPYLRRYLDKVEEYRRAIILKPLPPRRELELQFETIVQRIEYGSALSDTPLIPTTIKTILANQIVFAMQKNPHRDPEQKTVLSYKEGLDYIKREWLLNSETVTSKHILELFHKLTSQPMGISEQELKDATNYVQTAADHPIIQGAIAKFLYRRLIPLESLAETFSTLCAYLFLYRGGQDTRHMLLLERAWNSERRIYKARLQIARERDYITGWIEYFVKTLASELERIYQAMDQSITVSQTDSEIIGKLNERQKTIMTLLDDPKTVITNRTIQKIFHISQITASRDLAKLTQLGLLFTQGKGRSVRYTRI